MLYIDDFYFLFYCLDIEEDDLLSDVEDIVISLIDLQGDNIYYSPLCIAQAVFSLIGEFAGSCIVLDTVPVGSKTQ